MNNQETNNIIVPLGYGKFSKNPKVTLKTYALGSCLGLSFYSPSLKLGGLMHIALPESSTNPQKSKLLPFYFVDSALVALIELCEKHKINPYECELKVAGGANMSSPAAASQITNPHYDIGRRNIEAIEIGVRNWGLAIKAKSLGGKISRNMSLDLSNGKVLVYNTTEKWEL